MRSAYFWRMRSASARLFSNGLVLCQYAVTMEVVGVEVGLLLPCLLASCHLSHGERAARSSRRRTSSLNFDRILACPVGVGGFVVGFSVVVALSCG